MSSNLLDTKTFSLNEILGNGKIYRVPHFQRGYSWEEDQWEDLWNDIISVSETKESHYMGLIVLQKKDKDEEKEFWIIDGQQQANCFSE